MNNVEWDAIELPSQFMENFCWEWEVIRHMSGHIDTGVPLPREVFERMLAAKNFQAGMHFVRQLQFALFDLQLHMAGPTDLSGMQELLQRVRDEVGVFAVPDYNRFPPAVFAHLRHAYAAGYYSYLWAEVPVADAYSPVRRDGCALGRGGAQVSLGDPRRRVQSVPREESFVAFRGRAPRIDALFRTSMACDGSGRRTMHLSRKDSV
jgi:oligopeptidase A